MLATFLANLQRKCVFFVEEVLFFEKGAFCQKLANNCLVNLPPDKHYLIWAKVILYTNQLAIISILLLPKFRII